MVPGDSLGLPGGSVGALWRPQRGPGSKHRFHGFFWLPEAPLRRGKSLSSVGGSSQNTIFYKFHVFLKKSCVLRCGPHSMQGGAFSCLFFIKNRPPEEACGGPVPAHSSKNNHFFNDSLDPLLLNFCIMKFVFFGVRLGS